MSPEADLLEIYRIKLASNERKLELINKFLKECPHVKDITEDAVKLDRVLLESRINLMRQQTKRYTRTLKDEECERVHSKCKEIEILRERLWLFIEKTELLGANRLDAQNALDELERTAETLIESI